jgi:hypothetical protein
MRLARRFESLPLTCPHCGADMRIVAFITETAPVARILMHIGEPPQPPPIAPARWAAKSRPKARRGRRSSLLHLSQGPHAPSVEP